MVGIHVVLWRGLYGLFQDVGHFEQIFAESLDAEDFGVADLLLHPISHVLRLRWEEFLGDNTKYNIFFPKLSKIPEIFYISSYDVLNPFWQKI